MDLTAPSVPTLRSSAARPNAVRLLGEAARETWARRYLIRYLIGADLKKAGANTVLGNVWWVLDPLLQMIVYVILVQVIFQRSLPDYPLFIFAAILPWKWFSTSLGDSIVSISSRDKLIKQVRFPKIVLPVSAILAGIVRFGFGLIVLVALMLLFYRDYLSLHLLLMPVVAAVQLLFTLGLGLLASVLNVFFRDIANLSRHLLRLWFYLSPALWGAAVIDALSEQSDILPTLIRLNPFYPILTSYRDLVYYQRPPDWIGLGAVLLLSLGLLTVGAFVFKRLEPTLAKVL